MSVVLTSPQELSAGVRVVVAHLESGMPLGLAWDRSFRHVGRLSGEAEDSAGVAQQGESGAVPQWFRVLGDDVPFPGIAQVVSDFPGICSWAWRKEKHRSNLDRQERQDKGLLIRHLEEDPLPETVTHRWWRGRSSEGKMLKSGVRMLSAALEFTQFVGAAPAEVLQVIARSIEAEIACDQQRRVAKAGPRASARVLGIFPLLGVCGAGLMGINVVDFFTSSLVGVCCLVAGIVLMLAGAGVMRLMLRRAEQASLVRYDAALAMDLAAAALNSGASIPQVLHGLGHSLGVDALSEAASRLLTGEPWWWVCQDLPVEFAQMMNVLEESWAGGAGAVESLLSGAMAQRRSLSVKLSEASARLGIRLLLPLGLLQLPAFIVLGVIPVIAHLAQSVG